MGGRGGLDGGALGQRPGRRGGVLAALAVGRAQRLAQLVVGDLREGGARSEERGGGEGGGRELQGSFYFVFYIN